MKIAAIVVAVLLLAAVTLVAVYRRVIGAVEALPPNAPQFCQKPVPAGTRTVALLGDSLTHGTVSVNYVDLLEQRLQGQNIRLVNAGINSHLAYNLAQRLDVVLKCRPDYVVVLIGTNDVNALSSQKKLRSYVREQALPQDPDRPFFEKNLREIVSRAKAAGARVAVMSLPPIGEDLSSRNNQNIVAYSKSIEHIAGEERVAYLPLRESFWQALAGRQADARAAALCSSGDYPITRSVSRHYLLGVSWDQVARANKLHLLTDCLHLNSRGAELVVEQVLSFLKQSGVLR